MRTLEDALRLHSVNALGAELSHRLSQPLTAITYYCEILQQMLAFPHDGAGADAARYLNRIVEQVQRASRIVDELRNPGRGAEALFGLVDVRAALEAAMALQRPRLADIRARLELHCEDALPPVRGNGLQLVQVIHNLISNGFEAAQGAAGVPEVAVTARRTADGVHISVADNGPGVDRDRAHRIFDLFETSKPGRLGFGLGISRSIVNAHGGRLWCEAGPEDGAVFHMIVPIAEEIR